MFYRFYLRSETNVLRGARVKVTEWKDEAKTIPTKREIELIDAEKMFIDPSSGMVVTIKDHNDKYLGAQLSLISIENVSVEQNKGNFSAILVDDIAYSFDDILTLKNIAKAVKEVEPKLEVDVGVIKSELKEIADKPKKVKKVKK